MTEDELQEIERGFWTKGRSHYERYWHEDAVAGFPAPAGIMAGNSFVSGLPEEGGFEAVKMEDITIRRPTDRVIVLAYIGTGFRADGTARCICTSTYALENEEWRLVQHQQTPLAQ